MEEAQTPHLIIDHMVMIIEMQPKGVGSLADHSLPSYSYAVLVLARCSYEEDNTPSDQDAKSMS